jgi:hypothetical protein
VVKFPEMELNDVKQYSVDHLVSDEQQSSLIKENEDNLLDHLCLDHTDNNHEAVELIATCRCQPNLLDSITQESATIVASSDNSNNVNTQVPKLENQLLGHVEQVNSDVADQTVNNDHILVPILPLFEDINGLFVFNYGADNLPGLCAWKLVSNSNYEGFFCDG